MTNSNELLRNWLKWMTEIAVSKDEPLFLGLPDAWYNTPEPHFACETGHISSSYLKSTLNGNVCLECSKPVYLCPPDLLEERLRVILNLNPTTPVCYTVKSFHNQIKKDR